MVPVIKAVLILDADGNRLSAKVRLSLSLHNSPTALAFLRVEGRNPRSGANMEAKKDAHQKAFESSFSRAGASSTPMPTIAMPLRLRPPVSLPLSLPNPLSLILSLTLYGSCV